MNNYEQIYRYFLQFESGKLSGLSFATIEDAQEVLSGYPTLDHACIVKCSVTVIERV